MTDRSAHGRTSACASSCSPTSSALRLRRPGGSGSRSGTSRTRSTRLASFRISRESALSTSRPCSSRVSRLSPLAIRPTAGTTADGQQSGVAGTRSKYINSKNKHLLKGFFPNSELVELDAAHWGKSALSLPSRARARSRERTPPLLAPPCGVRAPTRASVRFAPKEDRRERQADPTGSTPPFAVHAERPKEFLENLIKFCA